jgi:hypothetical protein
LGWGDAVIELIEGLPDGVIGLEALGEVTPSDYTSVAYPAVEDALSRHEKISLIHVFGERFTCYTRAASGTTRSAPFCIRSHSDASPWSPISIMCACW